MNLFELIDEYNKIEGRKSGLLFSSGKCMYLINEKCCKAECGILCLNGICREYSEGFLIIKHGANVTVYEKYQRILKLREVIVTYRIITDSGDICGVFTGGNEVFPAEIQSSDSRIISLIKHIISGRAEKKYTVLPELRLMQQALAEGEINLQENLLSTVKPLREELH